MTEGGALHLRVSVWPPEGAEADTSQVGCQLPVSAGARIKTLDTKTLMNFPGWQHLCVQADMDAKEQLYGGGPLDACCLQLSLSYIPFHLADLRLSYLNVITHNCHKAAFTEFSKYSQRIIQSKGGLGDPWTCNWCQRVYPVGYASLNCYIYINKRLTYIQYLTKYHSNHLGDWVNRCRTTRCWGLLIYQTW